MYNVLAAILLFAYGGLAGFVWGFWRHRASERYPRGAELAVLCLTAFLHGWLVWGPFLNASTDKLAFSHALNLVVWLMLLLYLVGSALYDTKGLQILLYPLAILVLAMAAFFPWWTEAVPTTAPGTAWLDDPGSLVRAGSLALAYGLFGIAALFAIIIILLERDLRSRRMSNLMKFTPPLLSIEKLMFESLWCGLAFLTLSLAVGFFFGGPPADDAVAWIRGNVFVGLTWLIYASLMWCRARLCWRGDRAAWWVVVGFASLLLAHVGSGVLMEILSRVASIPQGMDGQSPALAAGFPFA